MKKSTTILILLSFCRLVYSQQAISYEQIALDFYASEILPKMKKVRIKYDGYVDTTRSSFNQFSEIIRTFHFSCMQIKEYEETKALQSKLNQASSLANWYSNNQIADKLDVPKPIRYVNKISYRQSNDKIWWLQRLLKNQLTIQYNLEINKAYFFDAFYYIFIQENKNDFELGSWYYIKINKTGEIIDWCESEWIS